MGSGRGLSGRGMFGVYQSAGQDILAPGPSGRFQAERSLLNPACTPLGNNHPPLGHRHGCPADRLLESSAGVRRHRGRRPSVLCW